MLGTLKGPGRLAEDNGAGNFVAESDVGELLAVDLDLGDDVKPRGDDASDARPLMLLDILRR